MWAICASSEGEGRTLFTYDSCAGVAVFPQPGLVYIHADACNGDDGEGSRRT